VERDFKRASAPEIESAAAKHDNHEQDDDEGIGVHGLMLRRTAHDGCCKQHSLSI
jgi:hypothetical protein